MNNESARTVREALGKRPAARRFRANRKRTVVSVCCGAKGHKVDPSLTRGQNLNRQAIFLYLLPSLRKTLRPPPPSEDRPPPPTAAGGVGDEAELAELFEYRVYVAFDQGDKFFDSPEGERAVMEWAAANLTEPLAREGVQVRLMLLPFENPMHKPGPAFNFVTAAAWEDGADYLYRVNDDSTLQGVGWPQQAVKALRAHSPPNVGVVGPKCRQGKTSILTHDFVHRTHLEIFDFYYPPVFVDWYMDDWVSKVYGRARTTRGKFTVVHNTGFAGMRYSLDRTAGGLGTLVSGEVRRGARRIEQWVAQHTSLISADAADI